jgi:hypothetical protein
MLSSTKFEADVDVNERAARFHLLEESVINYYRIQLKATYQPQDDKNSGHAHEEWRNWFDIHVEVWESRSHFV